MSEIYLDNSQISHGNVQLAFLQEKCWIHISCHVQENECKSTRLFRTFYLSLQCPRYIHHQKICLYIVRDTNTAEKILDIFLLLNCTVFQFVTRTHWDFISDLRFQCTRSQVLSASIYLYFKSHPLCEPRARIYQYHHIVII